MSLIYSMEKSKKFNGKDEFIDITSKLHHFLCTKDASIFIDFNTTSSEYMSLFAIYYKESLLPDFSININKGYIVLTTKENSNKLITLRSSKAYCDGKKHSLAFIAGDNKINVYIDGESIIEENYNRQYCDFAYVGFATIGRGICQDSYSNFFHGEISKFDFFDEEINYVSKSEKQQGENVVFAKGINGSCNYRIPSIITTKSGTVVASADARVDCPGDNPNNIDRAVRISKDNGKTWGDVKIIVDHGGIGREDGASAIDCSMIYDEEEDKILMIYCHKSARIGTFNCEAGIGFNLRGDKIIYRDNEEFYIDNNRRIVDKNNKETEYTCNELGDVYKDNIWICNISYGHNRLFTQPNTSYLQLVESCDDGETWSKPRELNSQVKEEWMKFLGAGPGTGIQVKNGKYKGRLIFPVYYSSNIGKMYSCSVIYSDDHGASWKRGLSLNDNREVDGKIIHSKTMDKENYQTTEAHVIELSDGTLKIFTRNYFGESYVVTAISENGGESWSQVKYEKQLRDPDCQNSVIKIKDGDKQCYIFSNPNHPNARVQGTLRYSDDDTKTWKNTTLIEPGEFGYSSLTQLANGDIGVLYEGKDLDIKFKSISIQDLKNK